MRKLLYILSFLVAASVVTTLSPIVLEAQTAPPITVLTAPTTQTLTDSKGQAWGLSAALCTASWASAGQTGVVTINGKADASTCGVVTLALENGVIWQSIANGNWYSDPTLTAGAWSAATKISPIPAPTPPVVSGTVPPVVLTWATPTTNVGGGAVSGPLSYNLYQMSGAGVGFAQVQSGITGTTATVTTGIPTGSVQCWEVTAVQAGVESQYSNSVCLPIPAPQATAPTLSIASP